MPFAVSRVKISLVSYPSYSQFGWVNRTDRTSYTAASNNYYNQGDSFEMTVNSKVDLTKGTANGSTFQYSEYKYAFKLFPGYLSFGLDLIKGDAGGAMSFILREIVLNIIAYR